MTTRIFVAENIRRLRKAKGWSQQDLGDLAGVGQTTVSSLEVPDGKSPTLETIAKVAEALDCAEYQLLAPSIDQRSPEDFLLDLVRLISRYLSRDEIDSIQKQSRTTS